MIKTYPSQICAKMIRRARCCYLFAWNLVDVLESILFPSLGLHLIVVDCHVMHRGMRTMPPMVYIHAQRHNNTAGWLVPYVYTCIIQSELYLLLASSYIINWVITKEKLRTFWFFWYMSKHPSKLAHTYKQKIGALGPVLLAGTTTHQACNQMKTPSKHFLSSQLKTCKSHGQKK